MIVVEQAAGPGRPSRPRPRGRHAGQRAAGRLPGPRRPERRARPGHRPPPGQGHLRPDRDRPDHRRDGRAPGCSSRSASAEKKYLLLVQGDIAEEEAAIEVPIGRDQRDRKKMAARAGGRESRTQFVGAGAVRRLHPGRGRSPERPDPPASGPLPVHRPPGRRRSDLRQRPRPDRACAASSSTPPRCGSARRTTTSSASSTRRSPATSARRSNGCAPCAASAPDSLPEAVIGGKNPPGDHP